MGSVVEMSENLEAAVDVCPTVVENGKSAELPEENLGNCESNFEDNTFHMDVSAVGHDQVMASRGNDEDLEVDIVGNSIHDEGEQRVVERESEDATENSSSFGYTDSGGGTAEAPGDMEVESQLRDDNASLMGFDAFNGLFRTRKKKLSTHWRNFIRPLMWRCKWVELQIRELHLQASKYNRELADIDKAKQRALNECASEDLAMKSAPFVYQDRSVKVMRRMKRKRVEETVNLASYMSRHSLFSYFGSKKSGANSAYMENDHGHTDKTPFGSGEFGVNGEWSSLEFKNSDSFETILGKIEEAQVHVRQLRVRMDKVLRENAENFASDNSRLAPCEPLELASCGPKSLLAHVNTEKAPLGSMFTTSQRSSKELVVPDTEVTPLPDAIENTDQPQMLLKAGKIENEILFCSRSVKEEFNDTEEVRNQVITVTQDQPIARPRSSSKLTTPKNKRKRGRRKARAGRWNRRSSG